MEVSGKKRLEYAKTWQQLCDAYRIPSSLATNLLEMTLYTDVTCPFCGCLCDDLTLEVQGDEVVRTERACPVAKHHLQQLNSARPPLASCEGKNCCLEQAVGTAAELLRQSRAPLVIASGYSGTEGARAAIELAEHVGGVLDTSGSALTAASTLSLQQVGISTCTLGEIKQRADLVIFWGADPERTHPRLLERYAAEPISDFLPHGRANRILVTINSSETVTERQADLAIRVPENLNLTAISVLRQLIRDPQKELESNLPIDQLRDVASRMKNCRYGVIFFGPGLVTGSGANLTVENLSRLVAELNSSTRFTARALGNPGAENVLAWQTGFPIAVDFQQRSPRYQPGEFSASGLLERGDVDACVIVGSDALAHLSATAMTYLKTLPTVLLDPPHVEASFVPTVKVTTALPGIQAAGTMYRLDDVALPLKKLYESPYPLTETVLRVIRESVRVPV